MTPEKVELGKQLFIDPRLSVDMQLLPQRHIERHRQSLDIGKCRRSERRPLRTHRVERGISHGAMLGRSCVNIGRTSQRVCFNKPLKLIAKIRQKVLQRAARPRREVFIRDVDVGHTV